MDQATIILITGYVFGFYMAWNIGANDVANSMASAVGAKAITIRQAVFIAGILNILGATFIGSHVTDTIRKGIVATDILNDPHVALIGALSALLAANTAGYQGALMAPTEVLAEQHFLSISNQLHAEPLPGEPRDAVRHASLPGRGNRRITMVLLIGSLITAAFWKTL